MSFELEWTSTLGGMLIGVVVAALMAQRRASALSKEVDSLHTAVEDANLLLADARVQRDEALEKLDEANQLCLSVREEFRIEERKKTEYLTKITDVLSERDVWRRLYHHESAGHAGAQSLMMGTINQLAQKLQKATGKPLKLDPLLETVRQDWDAAHGPEAREAAEVAAAEGRLQEHETEKLSRGKVQS